VSSNQPGGVTFGTAGVTTYPKPALHDAMKVGIVHFMAFPEAQRGERVAETVTKIAEDVFFGGIEVTAIADPQVRQQVGKILDWAHLVVGFGAQPVQLANKLDLNAPDRAKRQEAIDRLKPLIDQAYELGAQRFAVLSGPHPGDAQESEGVKALIESLNELGAYAASKGSMALVLETFDRAIDKKALIGPNKLGVEVAKAVRREHPTFGLMLDLSHLPLQFETAEDALQVAKDYITHIHIGNCVLNDRGHPLYGDLHPRFGCEGGENDVPELIEFLRVLRDIGYVGDGKQNVVGFEVRPHQGESSELIVANAKRTLMEAWARL
jgi:sugar phosphate isomerase/epimerase